MGDKATEIYYGKPFTIEVGKDQQPDLVNHNGEYYVLYQCPGCGKGFYVRSDVMFFTDPWCGECGKQTNS